MLAFLIYTIIMWMAGNCILKLFFLMVQKDGALDVVFGWQKMLERLYASTNKWKNLLGKALGDCHMCTAFWFMPGWFVAYWMMSKPLTGYYITDSFTALWAKILVWVLWYMVFHCIGAVLGGFFLIGKFRRK